MGVDEINLTEQIMGDWMTVQIVGTCDIGQVEALKAAASYDWNSNDPTTEYGPLNTGDGLAGLGDWPSESMSVTGNCAERDFAPKCVADHLETLAKAAPSLSVKVHCGGPYESKKVVKTVTLEHGKSTVGDAQIEQLPDMNSDAMFGRFFKQMHKQLQATER